MTKKIAIINYGMGNVDSVGNALTLIGGAVFVTNEPPRLEKAHACLHPGVGAVGRLERLAVVGQPSGQDREAAAITTHPVGYCRPGLGPASAAPG